jgi:leucyl/phenylalanyl-tRNA--protein transferase
MVDLPLTPELVLTGYRVGLFPMADTDGTIAWFSPDPRCIIPLDAFHTPRTVRQLVRRAVFEIRFNTAFEAVIAACSDRAEGTWISDDVRRVYTALFRQGAAHSVECWRGGQLAGGLYGVALGGAFFGESMFTRVSGASKVALVALVDRLRARGFTLLDIQWQTTHLARFGALEIPRTTYLRRLRAALARPCRFLA